MISNEGNGQIEEKGVRERVEGAGVLLNQLIEKKRYSNTERIIYDYVLPYKIEHFLFREIIREDGIISVSMWMPSDRLIAELSDSPVKKMTKEEQAFFARLVLLYRLNCFHNYRMMRCNISYCRLEEIDSKLLDVIIWDTYQYNPDFPGLSRIYYSYSKPDNAPRSKEERETAFRNDLFAYARYASFLLEIDGTVLPMNERVQSKDRGAVPEFLVKLKDPDEGKDIDYEQYIKFLLTKEGNQVDNEFASAREVWRQAIKTNRAGSILDLKPSDTDLQRFCLALGLNYRVYNKLRKLRDDYMPFLEQDKKKQELRKELERQAELVGKRRRTRAQNVRDLERNEQVEVLLKSASDLVWEVKGTLFEAANKIGVEMNPRDIPRRILVNVSIELLRHDYFGLVIVTEEEMRSMNLSESEIQQLLECQRKSKKPR